MFVCILWPEPEPTETGKKVTAGLTDLRAFLMSTGRAEEGPPFKQV